MTTRTLSLHFSLRRYFRWGLGLLLSGMAASAGAQSLSTMDILPPESPSAPSCSIQAPDGGRYRYQRLTAGQFQRQSTTPLPPMTRRWAVVCDSPTELFLQVRDLQTAGASFRDSTWFGLGQVNGQGELGQYQITLGQPDTDGRTTGLYETSDPSVVGSVTSQRGVTAGKYYGWSENGVSPDKGKIFSVDITVLPELNSLQLTRGPLVSGAELDGQAEITFSFGI